MLFNGSFVDTYNEFDNYLNFRKYKFKDDANEAGGYVVFKIKSQLATILEKLQKKSFQKIIRLDYFLLNLFLEEKVITNSGYFQDYKHQLNIISKSSATHSTLVLDNTSSVRFEEINMATC